VAVFDFGLGRDNSDGSGEYLNESMVMLVTFVFAVRADVIPGTMWATEYAELTFPVAVGALNFLLLQFLFFFLNRLNKLKLFSFLSWALAIVQSLH
jgi:hypothetical protein